MAQYTATVNADGTIVPEEIVVAQGAATIIYNLGPGAQWTRIPGGIVVSSVGTSTTGATASWPTGTASVVHSTSGETFDFRYVQINVTGSSAQAGPPGADPVIRNQGGGGGDDGVAPVRPRTRLIGQTGEGGLH